MSDPDLAALFADRAKTRAFAEQARPGWWEVDCPDLIGTMAGWLTLLLWRNTELEAVHAGWERAAYPAPAPGEDEVPRLAAILDGCPDGGGIPDDVMLRMNTSTTHFLTDLLCEVLPGRDALRDPEPTDAGDVAEALHWEMTAWDRPLVVGESVFYVSDLFNEDTWSGYRDGVRRGVEDLSALVGRYGWESYLATLPVRSRGWGLDTFYGGYRWGETVAQMRELAALPDQGWARELGGTAPGEHMWERVERYPWTVDGATARWMIFARANTWRLDGDR